MPKERGILFCAQLIPPILRGEKTMTRRVIKPQPAIAPVDATGCPYGGPGDILYVKEPWAVDYEFDKVPGRDFTLSDTEVYYRTAQPNVFDVMSYRPIDASRRGRWRSARFMPKWASRLRLQITHVHAERLQDISVTDAVMEGAMVLPHGYTSPRMAFMKKWVDLNGGESWDSNPLVWVISFRRVLATERPGAATIVEPAEASK